MELSQILLLAGAGFAAGAANAVVGGGTFFSFPALLGIGLPPVAANATSTLALWPGSLTASAAYFRELRQARDGLPLRLAVAAAGGVTGALLLLASGNALFFSLVPWLLALATALFAFHTSIQDLVSRIARGHPSGVVVPLGLEFVFAIYGGYFGAGLGVLLMAGLALAGFRDAQIANAQKNFLAAGINGVAALLFIVAGAIHWLAAVFVMGGAVAGGFAGAHAARRIPENWLRATVIAAGIGLSIYYFGQVYG
jgi:hypothetical protein